MSLQTGQKLPDFELKDENGTTISNQTFVGQKVIISIYAQDDTPSCTKQVCSLNEDVTLFEKAGYKVYGLSPDAEKKHQKFKGKYNITYPLLSDPEREVLKSWGLFGPKKFMGKEVTGVYRSAIVLDENGIITHFIDKVVTATHGQQLKEILGL